ncbi:MAG: YciI family protein [Actinomycetota bacterium]
MTGPHLLVEYDYVEDILERRGPFREEHLARLRQAKDRGLVLAAGAVGDPPVGAVIVLTDDRRAAEELVAADPYVVNGLVTGWRIRPWNVVV